MLRRLTPGTLRYCKFIICGGIHVGRLEAASGHMGTEHRGVAGALPLIKWCRPKPTERTPNEVEKILAEITPGIEFPERAETCDIRDMNLIQPLLRKPDKEDIENSDGRSLNALELSAEPARDKAAAEQRHHREHVYRPGIHLPASTIKERRNHERADRRDEKAD